IWSSCKAGAWAAGMLGECSQVLSLQLNRAMFSGAVRAPGKLIKLPISNAACPRQTQPTKEKQDFRLCVRRLTLAHLPSLIIYLGNSKRRRHNVTVSRKS